MDAGLLEEYIQLFLKNLYFKKFNTDPIHSTAEQNSNCSPQCAWASTAKDVGLDCQLGFRNFSFTFFSRFVKKDLKRNRLATALVSVVTASGGMGSEDTRTCVRHSWMTETGTADQCQACSEPQTSWSIRESNRTQSEK